MATTASVNPVAGQEPERSWMSRNKVLTALVFATPLIAAIDDGGKEFIATYIASSLKSLRLFAWFTQTHLIAKIVSGFMTGALSHFLGGTWISMSIATMIYLVGTALAGIARSGTLYLVGQALVGFSVGFQGVILQGFFNSPFTKANRAPLRAFFTALFGVGKSAGQIVGGTINKRLGWRWFFYLGIPLFGVSAIITIPILSRYDKSPKKEDDAPGHDAQPGEKKKLNFAKLGKHDWWGSFCSLGIAPILFAINAVGNIYPASSPKFFVPLIVGTILLFLLSIQEKHLSTKWSYTKSFRHCCTREKGELNLVKPPLFNTELLLTPKFGFFFVTNFVMMVSDAMIDVYIPVYFRVKGVEPQEAGLKLGIASTIGAIVGALIAGSLGWKIFDVESKALQHNSSSGPAAEKKALTTMVAFSLAFSMLMAITTNIIAFLPMLPEWPLLIVYGLQKVGINACEIILTLMIYELVGDPNNTVQEDASYGVLTAVRNLSASLAITSAAVMYQHYIKKNLDDDTDLSDAEIEAIRVSLDALPKNIDSKLLAAFTKTIGYIYKVGGAAAAAQVFSSGFQLGYVIFKQPEVRPQTHPEPVPGRNSGLRSRPPSLRPLRD